MTGTNSNKEQVAPDLKMRLQFPNASGRGGGATASGTKMNSDSGIDSSHQITYPSQKSTTHYNSYSKHQRQYFQSNHQK